MKNLKFKKITATEKIYLEAGYATNKVYLFKMDWLEAVSCVGNRQLRNKIKKARLEVVEARLSGIEVETKPILKLLGSIDLAAYREAPLEKSGEVLGFYRGQADKFQTVAYRLNKGPTIDGEFFPALLWGGDSVKVLTCGDRDPVLVVDKASGEIVAAISPLNPKCIE